MLNFDPFLRLMPSRLSLLNPFRWSKRAVRVSVVALVVIFLPVYAFVGMKPVVSADLSGYPTLSIPSIGLETPVAALEIQDRQLVAPTNIAGSYSQYLGKTLVIGHSSTVFEDLHEVETGETMTYGGNEYLVRLVETVAKPLIDMSEILAANSMDTIVIMTCAGQPLPDQDATHRLIVTATRIDDYSGADGLANFDEDEEEMRGGVILGTYLSPEEVVRVNKEVEI